MTFAEKLTETSEEFPETSVAPIEELAQANREETAVLLPPPAGTSMQDYYQLQQNLLRLTVAFSAVIFCFVWGFYSLNIALNYVIGACTGVVYLRMLATSVGKIGREAPKSNSGRLAVLIGVLVVSTQWEQLSVLPVFLGFLTYKAALITFVLWTTILPQQKAA